MTSVRTSIVRFLTEIIVLLMLGWLRIRIINKMLQLRCAQIHMVWLRGIR